MGSCFNEIPKRIFLDSCTVQCLGDYGEYIFDGGSINKLDRINRMSDGPENIEALRMFCFIAQHGGFEWIVSENSKHEASARKHPEHMQWFWELAHHSNACLAEIGETDESVKLAGKMDEPKFGYLSQKDKLLLQDAVTLRCDAFLTVERALPRNSIHLEQHIGIRIMTPIMLWKKLEPFTALWG